MDLQEMTGYTFKTTFWQDFEIANRFGEQAVRDTYERAFKEWKTDKVYVTELTLVLNWMIWKYYQTNEPLAKLYDKLWRQTDGWCMDNLKGDDLDYYIRTTD